MSGSTVDGHNAEVDSAHQEGQHQAAQAVYQEDGGQVHAVKHRIQEEEPRGGGRLNLGDTAGQHEHQHQFPDEGGVDQTAGNQRNNKAADHRGDAGGKRHQQTGKHPAKCLLIY